MSNIKTGVFQGLPDENMLASLPLCGEEGQAARASGTGRHLPRAPPQHRPPTPCEEKASPRLESSDDLQIAPSQSESVVQDLYLFGMAS